MPNDRTGGDNLKVSYAKGHEMFAGEMTDVGGVADTLPGSIPTGSAGANERLAPAKGHLGNVDVDGVPSASGGAPMQDSTLGGSSGALGNVRVSKWGTEDLG